MSAEIEVPDGGGEGMLVTQGGRFAGWGLYLLKGKPVFVYNLLDLARPRIEAPQALSAGKHTVDLVFTYDGPGLGKGGTAVMKVDGAEVASGKLPQHAPLRARGERDLRHRLRYRHRGRRRGLHLAVPVHREARLAHDQARVERLTHTDGTLRRCVAGWRSLIRARRRKAMSRLHKILVPFDVAIEGATGLALIVVPAFVARLLLGADLSEIGAVTARVAGIALVALAFGAWLGREDAPASLPSRRC